MAVLSGALAAAPTDATVLIGDVAKSTARSGPTFRSELTYSDATMTPTGALRNTSVAGVGRPHGPQFFVARFGGGVLSDKVPVVPETPHAALIAGVMLLALRLRARLPPG